MSVYVCWSLVILSGNIIDRCDGWKIERLVKCVFCVSGRVNLIGEHIDYEGYSVLPMAIRQDTIVAIRKNEGEKVLRIANVNEEKYSMCTYPADPSQVDLSITVSEKIITYIQYITW